MPNALPVALRLGAIVLTGALCSGAVAQESFSTLEERMTGREFRETGLHKLSDEELAALNRWIRARSLTEREAIELSQRRERSEESSGSAGGDQRGFTESERESDIDTRIVGSFKGWRGGTEFELENGMVWRQAESDIFAIPATENPRVTISKGLFGVWYLSVEGYSRRVRVERVR